MVKMLSMISLRQGILVEKFTEKSSEIKVLLSFHFFGSMAGAIQNTGSFMQILDFAAETAP